MLANPAPTRRGVVLGGIRIDVAFGTHLNRDICIRSMILVGWSRAPPETMNFAPRRGALLSAVTLALKDRPCTSSEGDSLTGSDAGDLI
jgi:hypothetical protein